MCNGGQIWSDLPLLTIEEALPIWGRSDPIILWCGFAVIILMFPTSVKGTQMESWAETCSSQSGQRERKVIFAVLPQIEPSPAWLHPVFVFCFVFLCQTRCSVLLVLGSTSRWCSSSRFDSNVQRATEAFSQNSLQSHSFFFDFHQGWLWLQRAWAEVDGFHHLCNWSDSVSTTNSSIFLPCWRCGDHLAS